MRSISYRKGNLDKMAGEMVRARGKCQAGKFCQQDGFILSKLRTFVWAHIIPRDYLLTRWDLDNALCLHLGCEMYFTSHPREQKEMFISVIGQKKYEALRLKANNNQQPHPDYGKIRYELKQQYKVFLA